MNDLHLLPVDAVNTSSVLFVDSWHLEKEELKRGLMIRWLDCLPAAVEDVGVFHKPTVEASEDDDFILIHLSHSKALTGWELVCW